MAFQLFLNVATFTGVCFTLIASLFALVALYNVYLHPLRSYPGPKLWATTRLVWIYHEIRGELPGKIKKMHERYGPVVRIAPKELSYITSTAWRDIYGHRDVEMTKNLEGAGMPPPMPGEAPGLANASRDDHSRMRRVFSPAFSDRALREQEPYLHQYIDQLIQGLRRSSGAQNIVHWFNWTAFDIIGDLAFGEPFGCLKNIEYHPFVANIFLAIKGFAWLHLALYLGIMPFLRTITPRKLMQAYDDTIALGREKVDRRLEKTEDRKDFLSYVVRNTEEGKGLKMAEIYINAAQIIAAGSETAATLLSGATYHLLRDERVYKKLTTIIRETFVEEKDITIKTTAELPYLNAVIEESLRIYPPAAGTMPRIVPGVGCRIDGRWVPGGTTVGVHQYSTNHSPLNFHQPSNFIPERWLPTPAPSTESASPSPFSTDNKASFQPFSYGPRNCIGKNLAYAEIRLVLTRLFWNFDVELAEEEVDWKRQKAYLAWDKPPLMVFVRAVAR